MMGRLGLTLSDVACRRCGDTEAAGMLLCDACDHGFHMECLGMRRRCKPSGLWFCPDRQPDATMTLAQLHTHTIRPPGREGPWRLRYGWCMIVTLLY